MYREASVKIPHRDGNKVIGLDCHSERGASRRGEEMKLGAIRA